jgi:NAD(P)H dehydrogenase (quinone)
VSPDPIVVGVAYSYQALLQMGEITGGSQYGGSTITGSDSSRHPIESELEMTRSQCARVAQAAYRFARRTEPTVAGAETTGAA